MGVPVPLLHLRWPFKSKIQIISSQALPYEQRTPLPNSKQRRLQIRSAARGLLYVTRYELPICGKRSFAYLEFSSGTSVDISSHSPQLQVIVKDPLLRTNDTSSALETFSDSGLY